MRMWYYVVGNEKKGPIPEEELIALLKSGELSSDTLVWTEGMEEWAKAGADQFLKNEAAPNPEKKKTPSKARKKKQKGFGRKNYFLCNLSFPFVAGGLLVLLVSLFDWSLDDDAFVTVGFGAIYYLFTYFFIVLRYKNIGYRPAWTWSLWSLIPLVNLWVIGRCLYQPADYRNTRQMDKAGKIIFWLYWLLLCSPVVITIVAEML